MPLNPDRIEGADAHLANDLALCITNDGKWTARVVYLHGAMAKNVKRGVYDPVLTGRAWRYLVENYLPTYKREQGFTGRVDVATRNLAGRCLEEWEREDTYNLAGVPDPGFPDSDAQLRAMGV